MRPKPCRLATHSELQQRVASKLMQDWSPQQVSGWLKMEYPNDESLRVSIIDRRAEAVPQRKIKAHIPDICQTAAASACSSGITETGGLKWASARGWSKASKDRFSPH